MIIERLPSSLLNGEHLHCRPVKGGPIIEATIVPSDDESTPTFRVAIVCPARRADSKCGLRDRLGIRGPRRCLWYRGDSLGEYQIIGPDADKKSKGAWKNKQ